MEVTKDTQIGALVAKDYRTASVFKKYQVDFCCNGGRSIAEALEGDPEGLDQIINDLNNIASQTGSGTADYHLWPLDLLADYVEKRHHRYVTEKIGEIKPYLDKIVLVHGAQHPELAQIQALFDESAGELSMHMKKEELMLFPYIRKMVQAKQSGTAAQAPFGTVQHPIRAMMHEHDAEGERFRKIAALSDDYTPPADACNTYRVTFAMLKEFEEDLHLHIHLENNILFPKAIEMEEN